MVTNKDQYVSQMNTNTENLSYILCQHRSLLYNSFFGKETHICSYEFDFKNILTLKLTMFLLFTITRKLRCENCASLLLIKTISYIFMNFSLQKHRSIKCFG